MSEKKTKDGWMDAGGSGANWPGAGNFYKAKAKVSPPAKLTKAQKQQLEKDMLRVKREIKFGPSSYTMKDAKGKK